MSSEKYLYSLLFLWNKKFKIVVDIETRPAEIRIYSKLKPKNKLIVVITKNEAKKLKKY